MWLCLLLIMFSSNLAASESLRMILHATGTTVWPQDTAWLSAYTDNSWKRCTWQRSDQVYCEFVYRGANCLDGEAMTEYCSGDLDGSGSFFGDYSYGKNLDCGLKLENTTWLSETTWTVEVQRCLDDSCCYGRVRLHDTTVRLYLMEEPKLVTLGSETIDDDDGNVMPGSTHNVTCQVGGGGDAGWVKPEPKLTWWIGDERFNGTLGDIYVTKNPGQFENPGLGVTQTATLVTDDVLFDDFTLTCKSTVHNSSSDDNEELFSNTANLTLTKAGCVLPNLFAESVWGCNGTINGGKVGNYVSCNFRCGQGGSVDSSVCKGRQWTPPPTTQCSYTGEGVVQFFETQDPAEGDPLINPPQSDSFDQSMLKFTAPLDGLYVFGVSSSTVSPSLVTNKGVVGNTSSVSGSSSSLLAMWLEIEDTIQAGGGSAGDLTFLGTGLHSAAAGSSAQAVSCTESKELGYENFPQDITMAKVTTSQGNHLTYDEASGCIRVAEQGTYLVGLTLSSMDSSYASLHVKDTSLGLGDDSEGQGMMSNSAIMQLDKDSCIKPQLEPLSRIYAGDRWTQLFAAAINTTDVFSYALSQPQLNQSPEPVPFDLPLHPNDHFSDGTFRVQDDVEFNPRRFYQVFVNAFLAQGELVLELRDKQGSWKTVRKVQSNTRGRRMVSMMAIVEMDNDQAELRVTSIGLLDEGGHRFATFSGFRIG